MKLILSQNGKQLKEYEFSQQVVTLGRTAKNDVCLEDLSISSSHASIFHSDRGIILKDMDSTNGTFVNDGKVSKHTLQNGDIIRIADFSLEFVEEEVGASFDSTVMMQPVEAPSPDEVLQAKVQYETEDGMHEKKVKRSLWQRFVGKLRDYANS